ncbi:hypothetical protein [Paraflavitalea speifideaquila]|uniref:hypothetical protein n=1 Tax=Paraflavitalea speifideaquila TaxID=3076558 RepID=UPI0028E35893|nr:hypothetical protein [Paraflavitalea speifideiaquila]
MKKLLLVLAIGAFVASCNDGGTGTETKTDTTAAPAAADTTAPAAADTTVKAADTTAPAAAADTTKK